MYSQQLDQAIQVRHQKGAKAGCNLCVQAGDRLDLLKAGGRGLWCRCGAQHYVMFENVGVDGLRGLRWRYMYRHGRRRGRRIEAFVTPTVKVEKRPLQSSLQETGTLSGSEDCCKEF